MKIIEALKKTKDLARKLDDLKLKVANYHVDYESETPTYDDQRAQVGQWMQAHADTVKEISDLRYRIQKTNLATPVTIELGGKSVTKSISEWIYRRKDLANLEHVLWGVLTDKNLKPVGSLQKTTGEIIQVNIRRYYDPKTRDEKKELFRSEPSIIDGKLEVVNAVTDLLEK